MENTSATATRPLWAATRRVLRATALLALAAGACAHYESSALTSDPQIQRSAAALAALLLLSAIALPPTAFEACLRALCFGFVGWRGPLGALVQSVVLISVYLAPLALARIVVGLGAAF